MVYQEKNKELINEAFCLSNSCCPQEEEKGGIPNKKGKYAEQIIRNRAKPGQKQKELFTPGHSREGKCTWRKKYQMVM